MLSDDKKPDGQAIGSRDRDNDTPDTVISSSSPECVIPELPIKFPGMVMNCVKCCPVKLVTRLLYRNIQDTLLCSLFMLCTDGQIGDIWFVFLLELKPSMLCLLFRALKLFLY
jgi:hypothetical protein